MGAEEFYQEILRMKDVIQSWDEDLVLGNTVILSSHKKRKGAINEMIEKLLIDGCTYDQVVELLEGLKQNKYITIATQHSDGLYWTVITCLK